tara:strand:+ start:1695 stop:3773 length:2079 start_codon:yes stop_codon:yes gene_type:complete
MSKLIKIRPFLISISILIFTIWILGYSEILSIKYETKDFSLVDNKESKYSSEVANLNKNAYFGDLHVHTKHSFDAFIFGTTNSPDQAYLYAKGKPINHPLGFEMKLQDPLDFYAVTDHAAWLGMLEAYSDPNSIPGKLDFAKDLHGLNNPENLNVNTTPRRSNIFGNLIANELVTPSKNPFKLLMAYLQKDTVYGTRAFHRATHQSAWKDIALAAEKHNEPGKFTTFIAYEFTSSGPGQSNLHRNVIFKDSNAPIQPFSIIDSMNPEDLWNWMDRLREKGVESLAIPHNSNGSNGQMFKLEDWAGNPLTLEYSEQRSRNEPLVEITQVKGTSDTHPLLSPNDEWADFEIMNNRVASPFYSSVPGSYVRDAYLRGLSLEAEVNINPYKFGLIGASDTHTGAISDDEADYHSKVGIIDGTPQLRGSVPLEDEVADALLGGLNIIFPDTSEYDGNEFMDSGFLEWGASGLAAVWAEENTREAIYNAFRRKETFATTGSRIKVRFFSGYSFDDSILDSQDLISIAYEKGVTMGSDLLHQDGKTPNFLIWAIRDAKRAPLDRVQIIKGWVLPSGKPYEQIFDIGCSGNNKPDPISHRCPETKAKVDLKTCKISKNIGSDEIKAIWSDPEFDPSLKAFYYVRVLENPTCRWSTWDAIKNGTPIRPNLKSTIQERAWSSPIWYIPPEGEALRNILPEDV